MLNDTKIRNAKPRERDYKLTDFDGLYLLVCKNGSKLWRFAYRFEGKQKQIALGHYPEVSLAEARERRDASRKLLASGKNPSLERRLEKIARAAGGNTFRDVAEEFLDKQRREERSEATLMKTAGYSSRPTLPLATVRPARSPRRNCFMPCANSNCAAATRVLADCARLRAWSSAMRLRPAVPRETSPLTFVVH
jgi:Arm DNA-binding domain